jgi:hypothetical protein
MSLSCPSLSHRSNSTCLLSESARSTRPCRHCGNSGAGFRRNQSLNRLRQENWNAKWVSSSVGSQTTTQNMSWPATVRLNDDHESSCKGSQTLPGRQLSKSPFRSKEMNSQAIRYVARAVRSMPSSSAESKRSDPIHLQTRFVFAWSKAGTPKGHSIASHRLLRCLCVGNYGDRLPFQTRADAE